MVMDKRDYFVSFCFVQENDVRTELEALVKFSSLCEERLLYWEIIYVIRQDQRHSLQMASELFASITNLRILVVQDGENYYWCRAISANEAIGDVIVISCFNELSGANLLDFADEAMARKRVTIGIRAEKPFIQPFIYWIVGLISQFRIDARKLKTIAFPRDQLVAVLARPYAPILLRFEAKRGFEPYLYKTMHLDNVRGEANLSERLELLSAIISTSSTRFLHFFASVAALVTVIAMLYGFYAVGVILLQENVQPGWFSTALSQSGSTAFLSFGLAIIALGIANVTDLLDGRKQHSVIEEIGNISFYERVHDLNVDSNLKKQKTDEI